MSNSHLTRWFKTNRDNLMIGTIFMILGVIGSSPLVYDLFAVAKSGQFLAVLSVFVLYISVFAIGAWLVVARSRSSRDVLILAGDWLVNGDPNRRCVILQDGNHLTLTNDSRDQSTAVITNNHIVAHTWKHQGLAITGDIVNDGRTVNWNNGTNWQKTSPLPFAPHLANENRSERPFIASKLDPYPTRGNVILEACYGLGDKWRNITEHVVKLASTGQPLRNRLEGHFLKADLGLDEDPIPGQAKKVVVIWLAAGGHPHIDVITTGCQLDWNYGAPAPIK